MRENCLLREARHRMLLFRRAAGRKQCGIIQRHLDLSMWFTPGQGVCSSSPMILLFWDRSSPREVQGPRINVDKGKTRNMFLFLPDFQLAARIFPPITEHRQCRWDCWITQMAVIFVAI